MKPIAVSPSSFVSVASNELVVPRRGTIQSTRIQVAAILFIVSSSFSFATMVPADAQESKKRLWRDATGQFSVEATLIEVDETSVKLLTKDSQRISVPITKLSPQDRKYLRDARPGGQTTVTPSATSKVIANSLAGPPLPPAEANLAKLHELLPFPVFIDVHGMERIGLAADTPVKLTAGHGSLQEQLDDALEVIGSLSWFTTQSVLVVSSTDALERHFADTKLYRIATVRGDFSSVMQRIQQVSPDSWEALGGAGTVVPLPGLGAVYAIRQSPEIHRQLAKAFRIQPFPHRYGHPLDLRSVSISGRATSIKDILASISEQIDVPIEESKGLLDVGLDLSRERMDVELDNVSAKDALDLVLSQVACTWLDDGKKLMVDANNNAEKALSTQNLAIKPGAMAADSVMNTVQRCVAPDCWEVLGGKGSIRTARPGLYVIQQGQPAMREVEQFVRDLQMVR